MKIKHINGTSQLACSCGSWLKHWERFSGRTAMFCSGKVCMEKQNLVGAHVQKDNSYDSKWHIVPLCNAHNLAGGEMDIPDATILVSANTSETCG